MLSRYLSFAIVVCFRKYSRVRRYLPFLYLSTLSISSSTRIYLIFHRFAIPSRGIMQPWFPRLQRVVPDHPCFWIPFCKNPFISPSIPPLSLSYTLKYFDLSALASSLLTFIRWSSFTFRCNCSLWFLQCRHLIPQYVLVLHPFLRFTWSLDLSSPPQVCILLTVTLFPLPSPLPKLPFCSMSLANATFQYLINSITLFSYTKSSNYKFTKFNLSTIQHTLVHCDGIELSLSITCQRLSAKRQRGQITSLFVITSRAGPKIIFWVGALPGLSWRRGARRGRW